MGEVVELNKKATVEQVLETAKEYDLPIALVLGWDKDDKLVMLSNEIHTSEINWLLDVAKATILSMIWQ